jgi:malate synthase
MPCLSGADGWMFDGEDALGQVTTMSLDNQRNLKLAIHKDPVFLKVAEQVAEEMNRWSTSFLGREIYGLGETTGFYDQDFPGAGFTSTIDISAMPTELAMAASIVDATLYVVNNYQALQNAGSSIVLYLPKIQTAEEAGIWNELLNALEGI